MDAYHRSCPRCGCQLLPNLGDPLTPPWRCDECRTSYWVAELSQEARLSYRVAQRDFGHAGSASHREVRRAVGSEREEAIRRGVSIRHDQLGLFKRETLVKLLRSGLVISRAFEHEIKALS